MARNFEERKMKNTFDLLLVITILLSMISGQVMSAQPVFLLNSYKYGVTNYLYNRCDYTAYTLNIHYEECFGQRARIIEMSLPHSYCTPENNFTTTRINKQVNEGSVKIQNFYRPGYGIDLIPTSVTNISWTQGVRQTNVTYTLFTNAAPIQMNVSTIMGTVYHVNELADRNPAIFQNVDSSVTSAATEWLIKNVATNSVAYRFYSMCSWEDGSPWINEHVIGPNSVLVITLDDQRSLRAFPGEHRSYYNLGTSESSMLWYVVGRAWDWQPPVYDEQGTILGTFDPGVNQQ